MSPFKFNLNQKVKDSITGFTGTITARCQYTSGALSRYSVVCLNAGKLEENWFDETRLEVVAE
jgi:hypothetical protein